MATSFVRRARFIGDDRRLLSIPVSSTGFSTAIQNGDLVFTKSPTTDAGTIISFTDLADSGTKAQNQAAAVLGFLGVAQSRGTTAGQLVQVAPGGVFSFACTSATYTVGQLVGPEGTGTASAVGVSPTTLVGVAAANLAIGRVVVGGTSVTTIQVEIKSLVAGGTVPEGDIVATSLTVSGDLIASSIDVTSGNIPALTTDGLSEVTAAHGVSVDGARIWDGVFFRAQGAPDAESSTTPTLTAAELKGGLITSTNASAVTATLDTGSAMDTALAAITAADFAFDWVLINLGSASGLATVTAASGHTIVGLATVAINTSAQFRTRRTAANTWVTYRIS